MKQGICALFRAFVSKVFRVYVGAAS